MALTIDTPRFGEHGEFSGYLAYPTRATTPLPAIVVVQEAWGVDDHIEDVTRRFAQAGYAALAVDVYARGGERPAALTRERGAELKALFDELRPEHMMDPAARAAVIDAKREPLRSRLRESHQALFARIGDLPANLSPLLAAATYLRDGCALTRGQKVGSVGFCMGGALSARLAAGDPALSASVVFYGMSPGADEARRIACPVLGFYGALDARINPSIAPFAEAMAANGKRFEHHVYDGAPHAFFNDTRPSYRVAASRDAFARTLAFFRDNLT